MKKRPAKKAKVVRQTGESPSTDSSGWARRLATCRTVLQTSVFRVRWGDRA